MIAALNILLVTQKEDDVIRPLCIIFPQLSGFMKYFNESSKYMSIMMKNDRVLIRHNEIWNKIKWLIGKKFYSEPVYEKKYIINKVKIFNGIVNTTLLGDEIPKEDIH